jgi:predicted transcriptional regulator
MATTIQVEEETKKMLEALKLHPRECYNAVIKRLAESKIEEEPISQETLKNIEKALEDVKAGRVYSTREVKQKLGIE